MGFPCLQAREDVNGRVTDAIVEVDSEWKITLLDSRAEEILDVSADELLGRNFWDVLSDARGTQFEAVYREVMESRSSESIEAYYPGIDGWLDVYVYPDFNGGLSFYFRETTEQNEQRAELQRTHSRMELALSVSNTTVWEWDFETDSATIHPDTHTIFGTEISTGTEFLHAIHPGDRDRVQAALETAIETGEPYSIESVTRFDIEIRIVTEDDEVRWVQIEGEPSRDGGRHRVRGYIQDITEGKERAQRFEAIFNQTYQFTGLMEPDGTLIEANESALEFGGLSREDVIGKKVWNTHWFKISEETQRQTKSDVERAAAGTFVRRELEVQGADGTTIIDFSIRPVTDEDGAVVLLVPEGREISALKAHE